MAEWQGSRGCYKLAPDPASLSCVPPILIDTENTLKESSVSVVNPIDADCETAESGSLAVFK